MENIQKEFKAGDLIIYQNGDRYEIGKIKRVTGNGAFVWYSEGETAAKTPFNCMHRMVNSYVIRETTLGSRGGSGWMDDARFIDDGK